MSEALIDKLLQSFEELDQCISVTKQVLSEKDGVPKEVLDRVGQYPSIVNKQRDLASNLRSYISSQNWEEVARHVKLINGLSAMIRDDAQAILSGSISVESSSRKPSDFIC